jgi:prepilin-type processing-associated H-X9-DG protein
MQPVRRSGHTIVELLVVLGIIGGLLGLLIPAVAVVRDRALRAGCANNLRQIGLAMEAYHTSFGHFPAHAINTDKGAQKGQLGWQVIILPQLEQEPLYRTAMEAGSAEPDVFKNPPHTGITAIVPTYVCSSDGRLLSPMKNAEGFLSAFTSYIGIFGSPGQTGAFGGEGTKAAEILDGLGNTIMVSERPPPKDGSAGPWYFGFAGFSGSGPNVGMALSEPQAHPFLDPGGCRPGGFPLGPGSLDNPCDRFHLWSLHKGGANFLFCDGTVRFLPYSAHSLMEALASRAGQEIVELP